MLEIYKLFVEMADRNTQRRVTATSSDVLLVANTLIAALAAAGDKARTVGLRGFPSLVLSISGLLLCLAWAQRVRSYRALGAAKYQVLLEIEQLLPLQPYGDEWKVLMKRERAFGYSGAGWRRYLPPSASTWNSSCHGSSQLCTSL